MRRLLQTWAFPDAFRGGLAVAPPRAPLVAAAAVVAAARFSVPAAAQSGAPRSAAVPAGARLAVDSVWLKVPPILGPFGAATALQFQLPAMGINVPTAFLLMLPYLLALLAVAGVVGRLDPPTALTLPFQRGK